MAREYRLGLVGLGKIAIDQHLPAIAATPGLALVATVDPHPAAAVAPTFPTLDALLAADLALDAIVVCTPPQVRAAIARRALEAGCSVLLEKPPATTLDELALLARRAEAGGLTLYTAWHSRHAPMVEAARAWLAGRVVSGGAVNWCEDVRRWHPGQRWLWQAGGLGVFDPGINAFSILTAILPVPPVVTDATLDVPANADTPIAARLALASGDAQIDVTLDFLQAGPQVWEIVLDTACGHRLHLDEGGARLSIDAGPARVGDSAEYPALYAHFARLLAARASDVDAAPFALAIDALSRGTVRRVDPFIE